VTSPISPLTHLKKALPFKVVNIGHATDASAANVYGFLFRVSFSFVSRESG
jgi:hypothetical protein